VGRIEGLYKNLKSLSFCTVTAYELYDVRPQNYFSSSTAQVDLLKHPLLEAVSHMEDAHFGASYRIGLISLYLAFLVSLTSLVLLNHRDIHTIPRYRYISLQLTFLISLFSLILLNHRDIHTIPRYRYISLWLIFLISLFSLVLLNHRDIHTIPR
jgi:hypothetical protein